MPELVIPKDGPVEITLGDGSVVKGANLEDAFKSIVDMKVNASKAVKENKDLLEAEKSERERIQKELDQVKGELEKKNTPPPQPRNDDGTKFNQEKYFKMLGEDTLAALDYADSFRFGVDQDKVRDTFNNIRSGLDRVSQQVDVFQQQAVTAAFLGQHPEYPAGDVDAAKLLTQRVTELVKEGMPYNPTVVEFAYFQLVNSDKIKPLELSDDKNLPSQQQQPVPPSMNGSTVISEEAVKAEQLSDKDLLALLQSKGMFK
jgi:hypothetical protein